MKEYIEEKIKVLHQLGIFLTPDEKRHLWSLKTEIAVDAYARVLIKSDRIRIGSIVNHKRRKNLWGMVVRQSVDRDNSITIELLGTKNGEKKLIHEPITDWELHKE